MNSKQQLQSARDALLNLHKTLLDSERITYEAAIGPIKNPNHFLQLLTGDPWFAWLRPISELIVAMDEALDEKEPLTEAAIAALLKQAKTLLVASDTGEGFDKHYHEALQRDPAVVLAQGALGKHLTVKP